MIFPDKFVKANTATITGITQTEVTKYGLHTDVAKRGSPHLWSIDFKTSLWSERYIRELGAFLDTLDGQYQTFTMKCPLKFMGNTTSFNVRAANIAANFLAGSNNISVYGLPNNEVDALVAGDFVKFDNHDKVYKITETVDADGAGTAMLNFHPRLKADIAVDTVVSEAVFTLRLKADKNALLLSAKTLHHSLLISAIES